MSTTRRPRRASAVARFTATLVLPTPPLPPVTAITRTGRSSRSRLVLRIRLSSGADMGHLAETATQQVFIGAGGVLLGERHRARDEVKGARRAQVFGHPLSVAHIAQRQLCPDQRRERAAEAGGLVKLGQEG